MKTAVWARKQGEIAEKEAELAAMRKSGMPVLFLVLILALVTMVSALCGSLVGLPSGLHIITGPILRSHSHSGDEEDERARGGDSPARGRVTD